jgi:predicted transcriptional regulator
VNLMPATQPEQPLGPLQQRVLAYIWSHPGATARDCLEALNATGAKQYAYTTIKTVLDSLHKRRLVSRRRTKTAYHFTARQSQSGLLAQRLRELLARFSLEPQPIASSLVDVLAEDSPEQLAALAAELKQRGLL